MDKPFKTFFEPFRIKMVESISLPSLEQREQILRDAWYNVFLIKAEFVPIDLLTDSGTGAMSAIQWSKMMDGDESYACCRSFYELQDVVRHITGFKYLFPTHQGRAAERILFGVVGGPDKYIPSNTHFDTTRANIEFTGTEAVDLVIDEGKVPSLEHPFKGNINIAKLEKLIQEKGASHIPLCMLTVTNNSGGGQPVSMENIRQTKQICRKYNIPLFLDACRFAENAYFIKLRESGYQNKSILEIAQEMFSYADGCTMSAKKDGLVNIGGFLAFHSDELAPKVQNLEILTEGFPTYGGLAGRDLAALAQGLREVLDERYLEYRISFTRHLGDALTNAGIPVVRPIGGHAVYVDAKTMLPHIPPSQFPGQALTCELYRLGGIRAVEIGTFMFGKKDANNQEIPAPMELVRLAIPRRVYTQNHLDYVAEVLQSIAQNRSQLQGLKIIEEAPYLRHFSAKLQPIQAK